MKHLKSGKISADYRPIRPADHRPTVGGVNVIAVFTTHPVFLDDIELGLGTLVTSYLDIASHSVNRVFSLYYVYFVIIPHPANCVYGRV